MVTGGTAMKTMKLALLAVAAMVAASCVKETAPEAQDQTQNQPSGEVNYVQMEFTVNIPTKTTLGEDGKTVIWKKGDAISVFDNSTTATAHNNKFTVVEGGASTAVVTGTVPADATEFYAYYPYRSAAKLLENAEVGQVSLDQNQTVTPGIIADDVAGMMAMSGAGDNFDFKNACAHIKFTLAEDLTDIAYMTLLGNNMETIAGYFYAQWNDGEPAPSRYGNAFSYVNLKPSSGEVLIPGEYYFTIFPVNFTEGITVVLTRADGTQLMAKTTKPIELERNEILPMRALSSTEYKETENYFVKYINSADITIGGYTFNKTSNGDYTIVSDQKANTSITEDGLYFVAPGTDNVTIKGASSSFMVIGMEQGHRVPASLSATMKLTNQGTVFMLANLDINTSYNLLTGSPTTFGHYIINNCKITPSSAIPQQSLLNINTTPVENLMTYESISFEDSEIVDFPLDKEFRLLLGTSNNARWIVINNYIFRNNIVHSATLPETETIRFRLTNAPRLKMGNVYVENNTFSNVQIGNSLIHLNSASSENLSFKNNLFYANIVEGLKIVSNSTPSGGTVDNNYFYNLNMAMESNTPIYLGSSQITNLTTYNAPFKLSASPLHETLWDPANDVYGPYSITPAEGVSAPTASVGAYRDGMDTEAVSMLNSPSANYSTANIGKF